MKRPFYVRDSGVFPIGWEHIRECAWRFSIRYLDWTLPGVPFLLSILLTFPSLIGRTFAQIAGFIVNWHLDIFIIGVMFQWFSLRFGRYFLLFFSTSVRLKVKQWQLFRE